MLNWLRKLFGLRDKAQYRMARTLPSQRRVRTANPPASSSATDEAGPAEGATDSQESFPSAISGIGNLDAVSIQRWRLEDRQQEIFKRVEGRLDSGRFELPRLPSTSMAIMDMASKPSTEIATIATVIEGDPVLSGELLKVANSALFGGLAPTETLHDAIMRLGMRQLRSMILSLSMRGMVLRDQNLLHYAKEVWRQSCSVASIARVLAKPARFDPEHAFLLGLMHDIGKVALLAILSLELRKRSDLSSAVVGKIFLGHHERAGRLMAQSLNLSEEMVSVAGCHHAFQENEEHPRSAALVSLAHKLDLALSTGEEEAFWGLAASEEAAILGFPPGSGKELLEEVQRVYLAGQDDPLDAGDGSADADVAA